MTEKAFIPALGHRALTPLYDGFMGLIGFGERLRRFETDLIPLPAPARVLEVGCGTASWLRTVARRFPEARCVGLDPDARILSLAKRKLAELGPRVSVVPGWAQATPFADGSFDVILSSLMLHHLETGTKVLALREWRRLLAPKGAIVLVDFGVPKGRIGRAVARNLRWFEEVRDNLTGRVPELLTEAGLAFEEAGHYASLLDAYVARPAPPG